MNRTEKTNLELAERLMRPSLQAASRRLVQVLEEFDRTQVKPLEDALKAILADPTGCAFCDSGRLRSPVKGHDRECGFRMAEEVLKSGGA